jgi:hypothetical protein
MRARTRLYIRNEQIVAHHNILFLCEGIDAKTREHSQQGAPAAATAAASGVATKQTKTSA